MPTYDFRCEAGHVTEARRRMGCNDPILCPECGLEALRVPFYASQVLVTETGVGSGYCVYRPVGAETKDKAGRTRVSLMQEAASELDYAHRKQEEAVGHELPSKPYYKMGVQRAKELMAK